MAEKNKGGRPPKFNADDINKALESFINQNDEPLIQEFILNYGIGPTRFWELSKDNQELTNTIKKAINKQELYLIKNTQKGLINPTFAIFRLKQKCFGWTDKQEVESHNTNTNLNIDADMDLFYKHATAEEKANMGNLTANQVMDIINRK